LAVGSFGEEDAGRTAYEILIKAAGKAGDINVALDTLVGSQAAPIGM
jgi:hypothetical protein